MGDPLLHGLADLAINAAIGLDNILIDNPKADRDGDLASIRALADFLGSVSEKSDPRLLLVLKEALGAVS
jgi:hypothetical protein